MENHIRKDNAHSLASKDLAQKPGCMEWVYDDCDGKDDHEKAYNHTANARDHTNDNDEHKQGDDGNMEYHTHGSMIHTHDRSKEPKAQYIRA
jgi:hypothetical protein